MDAPREMISVPMGGGRFNFRAAAVILRDAHVLLHRATWDDYWSLPGGRVEWGEPAEQALAREIREELEVEGAIGPLKFVIEAFFPNGAARFHEVGFYYAVDVPERFPFRADGAICHTIRDGNADLEFRWVPADAEALTRAVLHPVPLRTRLSNPAPALEHIVMVEGEGR